MSATLTKSMTADELLAMPDDGYRYELVKGKLIQMAPSGDEHGDITMALATALNNHVKINSLGRVYAAETSLIDIVTLTEKDNLDGGDVVPGFQIRVAEIFA